MKIFGFGIKMAQIVNLSHQKFVCALLTFKNPIKTMRSEPNREILVKLFNELFSQSENTVLQFGADEPFYQAATINEKAVVFAREDYFSSALHEISHWCIAGKERRQLDDFGYWYEPEGRTLEQQQIFEQVEVKPQAVEWLLSLACNHQFHFLADNLSQNIGASNQFMESVTNQAHDYLQNELPVRAQLLFNRLNQYFRNNQPVQLIGI